MRGKRIIALLTALSLLTACAPAAEAEDEQGRIEISEFEEEEQRITPGEESDELTATAMRLRRTQGNVDVADERGKPVAPRANLGLYSDYQVATAPAGYAWIDLDQVKLTKLDEKSQIAIEKTGRELEIEVREGGLYFNVTEPLEEDETLTIRTSNLVVGIRGTCGWVIVPSRDEMDVYLLEGTAAVSAGSTTGEVHGGQVARLTRGGDEEPIALDAFTAMEVPEFALSEVRDDAALCEKILDDAGLDLYGFDPAATLTEGLSRIAYIGDVGACTMTAEQASAFARVLERRMDAAQGAFRGLSDSYNLESQLRCVAALADAGDGVPILLYGCYAEGSDGTWDYQMDIALAVDEAETPGIERFEVWQWQDGRAVRWPHVGSTRVYPGYLLLQSTTYFPPDVASRVYPMNGGLVAEDESTFVRAQGIWDDATQTYHYEYTVDGAPADDLTYQSWENQWAPEGAPLSYFGGDRNSGDGSVTYEGFSPAEDVLAALRGEG